jgi:hypothetical protein
MPDDLFESGLRFLKLLNDGRTADGQPVDRDTMLELYDEHLCSA